jgi:hypothetical protein
MGLKGFMGGVGQRIKVCIDLDLGLRGALS